MRLGLKLWSTNDFYIPHALDAYNKGFFDFIELFIVPGSLKFLPSWQKLSIPYSVHAPHSYQGLNWAQDDVLKDRRVILEEVLAYTQSLKGQYVVLHPGINGPLDKVLKNLSMAKQAIPELFSNALMENKPSIGLKGELCRGDSPEEIKTILQEIGLGFCLDFGHAVCFSAKSGVNYREAISNFLLLKPQLFHLSDGDVNSKEDKHYHFREGNYDLAWFLENVPEDRGVVIETTKSSKESLDDFIKDAQAVRKICQQLK